MEREGVQRASLHALSARETRPKIRTQSEEELLLQ